MQGTFSVKQSWLIWKILMELILVIQNSVQQDYRPEMYPSYQNISSFNVVSLHRPGLASHLPPPPTPKSLWKPWGWGKLLPNSQKFAHFPQQKNPLIDLQNPTQQPKIYSFSASEKSPLIYLHLSLSKVPFLPPSNSNFYVSTLWLQLQSFLFNFSLYVHICHANFD